MLDAAIVRANLARIRAELPAGVQILAATKYVPLEEMGVLHEAGVELVGENRTDSLLEKQERFGAAFSWDFIGHLQSRKVRELLGRVRLIQSLDSLSAARQIERRAQAPVACLLQVNLAGEGSKSGVAPEDVDAFLEEVAPLERVRFEGLMTMPPLVEQADDARPWFSALRDLRDRLAPAWDGRHRFRELSMGTSQDYLAAAAEGATIVRLGGVLFGR